MTPTERADRFDSALAAFVERARDDRTVRAVVRLGSGTPETLWDADSLHLWVVIADGTLPRRAADGDEPRIWRTLVEPDVDLHCELVERARFKRMVEGTDRNQAAWSPFCVRSLVYCADDDIVRWFGVVNVPAARDRRHLQLTVACWVAASLRTARRRLAHQGDVSAAVGDALGLAHAVAVLVVVDSGEVVEHSLLARARAMEPTLMTTVFTDVLEARTEAAVHAACDAAEAHLEGRWAELMQPVLRFLDRIGSPVPLSQLADQFATTSLCAGQLSAACELLVRRGDLTKLSAPMPLTKKSRVMVDEPAYSRS